MSFLTLLLIALGLSADAFAVAVGKGLTMRRLHVPTMLAIAAAFGFAQGAMPVIGWLLGAQLQQYIEEYDHWIAFGLLAIVGGKMLREAFSDDEEDVPAADAGASGGVALLVPVRELVVLAVATSIDALAVGIGFAFLEVNILGAAVLIGVVTFLLSAVGVVLGHRAGRRWRQPAEIAGGLVLIAIGIKIVLDHTGVL
jgi:putative Mn2+ efflux pump MntP